MNYKDIKSKLGLIIIALTIGNTGYSQENTPNFTNIGITSFSVGYGIEFPFGDLSDRFGENLKFTLGADRITSKNVAFGVDFSYMFGSKTKEDPISSLRLDNGEILGADNAYADVFVRERGLYLGLHVGKIFRLRSEGRSGIRTTIGAGVLQHNFRIIDEARSLPQIEGDYVKGYDRLTRGLSLRQYIGYQHISEDKRINFTIGFEFTEAFTKQVRAINFDTGQGPEKENRFDGLVSLKATFVLPFFDDYKSEEIFY